MRRLVVAAFLVAACGSVNVAQPHTIVLAYKSGDTYKYTLSASLKYTIGAAGASIPIDIAMSAKETVNVKSVDSTGAADLSIVVSDLSLKTTTNGTTNSTTTTNSTPVDMTVASDGRIVSVNGAAFGSNSLPGMSQMGGGLVSAILPDGTVKPGDTWTKDYDQANPTGSGAIHITTKNKYLRDEQVKGVNAAVVQSNIASNIDFLLDMSALGGSLFPTGGQGSLQGIAIKGTSTSDVTSWIDASAHRLVKTHSTGNVDATMTINMSGGSANPGLTGPITFKGTQTMDLSPV